MAAVNGCAVNSSYPFVDRACCRLAGTDVDKRKVHLACVQSTQVYDSGVLSLLSLAWLVIPLLSRSCSAVAVDPSHLVLNSGILANDLAISGATATNYANRCLHVDRRGRLSMRWRIRLELAIRVVSRDLSEPSSLQLSALEIRRCSPAYHTSVITWIRLPILSSRTRWMALGSATHGVHVCVDRCCWLGCISCGAGYV